MPDYKLPSTGTDSIAESGIIGDKSAGFPEKWRLGIIKALPTVPRAQPVPENNGPQEGKNIKFDAAALSGLLKYDTWPPLFVRWSILNFDYFTSFRVFSQGSVSNRSAHLLLPRVTAPRRVTMTATPLQEPRKSRATLEPMRPFSSTITLLKYK